MNNTNMTKIVQGGIYRWPETEEYAMYYNGALFIMFDDMQCIDMEVEHTSNLDELELVEGYALSCVKVSENNYEWQIRNSARKNSDDYILAKGIASKHFMYQMVEFKF